MKNNVRPRVFGAALARANANLEAEGLTPLPEGLTPHKLRHTFASLLVALGRDPVHVMGQLGHTDPAFSLRVYAHAMHQGEGEKEALRALVDGSRRIGAALDGLDRLPVWGQANGAESVR